MATLLCDYDAGFDAPYLVSVSQFRLLFVSCVCVFVSQVHLEAARLLAFTEDEFMKTLDWKV